MELVHERSKLCPLLVLLLIVRFWSLDLLGLAVGDSYFGR
jgi:hypothetical protein